LWRRPKPKLGCGAKEGRRKVVLSNYIERRPSREANKHLASQEIPHLLWNLKVHYCLQESITGPCPEADAFNPHLSTLFP
jgi:hypothetical protein